MKLRKAWLITNTAYGDSWIVLESEFSLSRFNRMMGRRTATRIFVLS